MITVLQAHLLIAQRTIGRTVSYTSIISIIKIQPLVNIAGKEKGAGSLGLTGAQTYADGEEQNRKKANRHDRPLGLFQEIFGIPKMGIMAIHTVHALNHHLFMHIDSQSFLGVAFTTKTVLVQHQQRGMFGGVRQMAGRTVSYSHRAMDKLPLDKVGMTHLTKFQFWAQQANSRLKIMTIKAFFFMEGFMPGGCGLLTGSLGRQLLTGLPGKIFFHLLFMIGYTEFISGRETGNPFKDGGQDLMAGDLIATGQNKTEGKKEEKGKGERQKAAREQP
jgi:hypothetical protein